MAGRRKLIFFSPRIVGNCFCQNKQGNNNNNNKNNNNNNKDNTP
jgi:hypothetical protein